MFETVQKRLLQEQVAQSNAFRGNSNINNFDFNWAVRSYLRIIPAFCKVDARQQTNRLYNIHNYLPNMGTTNITCIHFEPRRRFRIWQSIWKT